MNPSLDRILKLFVGCFLVVGTTNAEDARIEQFRLDNGARVTIAHVPDASKQVMQTWIPIGYLHDPASQPHIAACVIYSLLPEHQDPSDDIQTIAYTSLSHTSVQGVSQPDAWRDAMRIHLVLFKQQRLNRERIERELDRVKRGRTAWEGSMGVIPWYRKAVWNQILHHKKRDITIVSSLTNESFRTIDQWQRSFRGINERVDIAVIGPIEPKMIRKAIEETFGNLERTPPIDALPVPEPLDERIEARWDQSDRVVLMWKPLPDEEPKTRLLASLLWQLQNNTFEDGVQLQLTGEGMMLHGAITIDSRTVMLISASMHADTDYEAVVKGLEARFAKLAEPSPPALQQILESAEYQAGRSVWPADFVSLRGTPPHGAGENAEWMWLADLIDTARQLNVEPLQLGELYHAITEDDVRAFCKAIATAPSHMAIVSPEPER